MKIAVLGLGIMGGGMAGRLIGAGFDVAVYNRNPEKSAPFAGRARIAATPAEATEGADIVISMLADDNASRTVWLGDSGALTTLAAGTVCIESSTVSLDWVKAWAAAVESKGAQALDAPVTGSKAAAANGELGFIVGGSTEALAKAAPALEVMSKAVTHLGAIGSGATFKLINNFLCGIQLASLAETITLIERSGLDRDKAVETLIGGATGSPLVKMVAGRILADDYTPHFLLRLMAKDLTYATEAGAAFSVEMKTGLAALAAFKDAATTGYGDEDIAGIFKAVRAKKA